MNKVIYRISAAFLVSLLYVEAYANSIKCPEDLVGEWGFVDSSAWYHFKKDQTVEYRGKRVWGDVIIAYRCVKDSKAYDGFQIEAFRRNGKSCIWNVKNINENMFQIWTYCEWGGQYIEGIIRRQ